MTNAAKLVHMLRTDRGLRDDTILALVADFLDERGLAQEFSLHVLHAEVMNAPDDDEEDDEPSAMLGMITEALTNPEEP